MNRVMWNVLNWNKLAIDFYKKYNAQLDNTWLSGRLIKTQINKIGLQTSTD